jgi:RNA polymerase sigma factor (sigma-70 family)
MSFLANGINELSDDELLSWYQDTDDASVFIAELYRRFSDGLYLNAIKWLDDMRDAKEVAKDVRADVFTIVAQLAQANKLKIRKIKPYLYVITRHQCFAILRENKRISKISHTIDQIEAEVEEIEEEEERLRLAFSDKLMGHVHELDVTKQQIINLRFFQDKTLREISKEMTITITKVRGQLQWALKQLKKKIK